MAVVSCCSQTRGASARPARYSLTCARDISAERTRKSCRLTPDQRSRASVPPGGRWSCQECTLSCLETDAQLHTTSSLWQGMLRLSAGLQAQPLGECSSSAERSRQEGQAAWRHECWPFQMSEWPTCPTPPTWMPPSAALSWAWRVSPLTLSGKPALLESAALEARLRSRILH